MGEDCKITEFIGPPKLTRFERARIIGTRALQIALGAPMLVEIDDKTINPIDLAIRELEAGILPITIKRKLPDGTFAYVTYVTYECMKSLLMELYERYKRRFVVLILHIFIYNKD